MADVDGNVPGGYFMGRPTNKAEQQPQVATGEPKTVNPQIPGDYFIGSPENHRKPKPAPAPEPPQPAGKVKRSRSFMEWFCPRGGQAAN